MASTQARDAAERTRLSKAAVVARALALGDADGLEAVTYRRLAQELGVTPMALYWHFRNKEELLAGLAERIWSEIDTDIDARAAWPDQLRGILESLVGVLRSHPCASQLLAAGEKGSPSALKATEVTLEVLRSGGFDPVHAGEVARSALWTGITLVMSEAGYQPELSEDERAEYRRRNEVYLAICPRSATRAWSSAPRRWPTATRISTTGWAWRCSSPGSGPSPSGTDETPRVR